MPQPPNLQKMLAEAQAMLAAQQEAQEALKSERVEASAGGGMVKVAMTGDLRLESLTIDPDAVDPEDVEMLQDLVVVGAQLVGQLERRAGHRADGVGDQLALGGLLGLALGERGRLRPRERQPGVGQRGRPGVLQQPGEQRLLPHQRLHDRRPYPAERLQRELGAGLEARRGR